MNTSLVFSALLSLVGTIPMMAHAQGNCSLSHIQASQSCIIHQGGGLYTMAYRLTITDNNSSSANSCVMVRTSGNSSWHFPSYIKAYTNENNPGHQPRPYVMARPEVYGQDYLITNSPSTFACVKDIGPDCDHAYRSELEINFANNGLDSTFYTVSASQINAQLCSTQLANGSLSPADYTLLSQSCGTGGPLPVKLIDFKASKDSNGILLSWITADEVNFDHYEVERSSNAREFSTLTQTLSKQFLDSSANLSGRQYYRLKMVDRDGRFEYSKVLSLNFEGQIGAQAVYPNPVTPGKSATLSFHSGSKEAAVITITNSMGAILSQLKVQLSQGIQTISIPAQKVSGIYQVEIKTESGERSVQRLLVQ